MAKGNMTIRMEPELKAQASAPVSYTHLDVYKRQRQLSLSPSEWI